MFIQKTVVNIDRDKYGVPHVRGTDIPHAYYGYGYIAAVDRLFQLEMRRRQAKGELAEVLGKTGISQTSGTGLDVVAFDKSMRADYDEADLMYQFSKIDPDQQTILYAYLAGLNRRIHEVKTIKRKELAPQFETVFGNHLIDTALKEWTLPDLLAAASNALTSYVRNTTSRESDALHGALVRQHGADKANHFFEALLWINDPHAPTTKGDFKPLTVNPRLRSDVASHPGNVVASQPTGPAHASAEGTAHATHLTGTPGDHSPTTSMAILVGKDHLAPGLSSLHLNGPQPGWFQPSYFYTIGLHAKDYDVVGHAPGALIAITTGQNDTIAWGSTSAGGDHTTIYKEALQGAAHDTALGLKGAAHPVTTDIATIVVRNLEDSSKTAKDPLKIRRIWNGPVNPKDAARVYRTVIGDPDDKGNALSKQVLWKGHELTSVMAWEKATRTRDWASFSAQGQKMAMGYNWFYSDTSGNIGWLFGGFFPSENDSPRKGAPDSRLPRDAKMHPPVTGTSYAGKYWLYNPPSGYIVNWNNKPAPDYDHRDLHIPRWSQGDRANILLDLMRGHSKNGTVKFSEADIRAIYQSATTQDVNYYHFAPVFDFITEHNSPNDPTFQQALTLLKKWDGHRLPDPQNPANYANAAVPIFQAWLDELVKGTMRTIFAGNELTKPAMASPYNGTLQLNYMKNSVNLSMGTKIVLRALQFALKLRDDAPAPALFTGEDAIKAVVGALTNAVERCKKEHGSDITKWRQSMVPQEFFADNYEMVTTGFLDRYRVKFPTSANRGAMQRLAIASSGRMHVRDANPPGVSEIPQDPHYQDQLPIYGHWDFKDLPLSIANTNQVASSIPLPVVPPPVAVSKL